MDYNGEGIFMSTFQISFHGHHGLNIQKMGVPKRSLIMKEKIILPTIAETRKFVEEATRCDFDIDVFYNRVTIDAKSILGIAEPGPDQDSLESQFNGTDEVFEVSGHTFTGSRNHGCLGRV